MWTAGFMYSWSKMEVAAEDGWRQVVCGYASPEQQGSSRVGFNVPPNTL